MNVYVASSWRNGHQPAAVLYLKQAGFDVYDFRNPYLDNHGFHWSEIDPDWQKWSTEKYITALKHPVANGGLRLDWRAMVWAQAGVLVLPCGRSAHLEAGYFVGAKKPLIIYIPVGATEPELMYKMAQSITTSLDETVKALKYYEANPL
jgi:hypothetical protein